MFHDTRRTHAELERGGTKLCYPQGRKNEKKEPTKKDKGDMQELERKEQNSVLVCKWPVSLDVQSFLSLVIVTPVVN